MQHTYNTKEKEYKIFNKNILELKQSKISHLNNHLMIDKLSILKEP